MKIGQYLILTFLNFASESDLTIWCKWTGLIIVLGLGETIWSIADKQRTVWHLYPHGNSQTSEQSIGEKCFKKNHSLCSIWCRSVNSILCKEGFRIRETRSVTKSVYFRSCIIKQWLWFFGVVSSHNELEQSSATFSSPRKVNLQADQEVAVQFEEQMSGNIFSRRAETSLAAQYPDPLHIPKHFKHICFPPAASLWIIYVLSDGVLV